MAPPNTWFINVIMSSPVRPQPTNQHTMNLLSWRRSLSPPPPPAHHPARSHAPEPHSPGAPPSPTPGPPPCSSSLSQRAVPVCSSSLPPCSSLPRTLIFPAQCPSVPLFHFTVSHARTPLLPSSFHRRLPLSNSNTATYKYTSLSSSWAQLAACQPATIGEDWSSAEQSTVCLTWQRYGYRGRRPSWRAVQRGGFLPAAAPANPPPVHGSWERCRRRLLDRRRRWRQAGAGASAPYEDSQGRAALLPPLSSTRSRRTDSSPAISRYASNHVWNMLLDLYQYICIIRSMCVSWIGIV